MDLTIIMPIHEINNETDVELFNNAKESLEKQVNKDFTVIYVIQEDISLDLSLNGIESKIIKRKEKFKYQTAVNLAVKEVNSSHFAILEFDDIFHSTYVKNFYDHLNNQKADVDLYLNIVFEVNKENQMMGLRNESAWIVNKMQKLGFLDFDSVKQIVGSFNLVGAIFSKESYLNVGGLKENLEIFFNQEFILRFLNNGYDVYVIPKIMVNHMHFRDQSYFDICDKKFNEDQKRGYFNIIYKEYLFNQDREINIE